MLSTLSPPTKPRSSRCSASSIATSATCRRCRAFFRDTPRTPGPPVTNIRNTTSLGEYDGSALILIGIALIVVATFRVIRIGRLIDDEATHAAQSVRAELILSLVLVVAALAAYIALT